MTKKKKSSSTGTGAGTDLKDKEKTKKKVAPPSKYQVVLYNDDYTPMNLVAAILVRIFRCNIDLAWEITMNVHEKGKGIAGGPYSKEIAETKAVQATDLARALGHPFLAKAEKIE